MEYRFAADRMLGRLARMLRLLGYDTLYAADMTTAQLRELARESDRVVLTRGSIEKRFPGLKNVVSIKSEYGPEQLREVAERFKLDAHAGLWTRCTLCNGSIERVQKETVAALVPPRVFEIYEEFFRCPTCGHIYWQGSHVARILKNLVSILGEPGN